MIFTTLPTAKAVGLIPKSQIRTIPKAKLRTIQNFLLPSRNPYTVWSYQPIRRLSMKRLVVVVLLLFFAASPACIGANRTRSSVDMRPMKHIFVGWIDLHPEAFASLDYSTKEEWVEEIQHDNAYFLSALTGALPDRILTMAKGADDENAAGNDLYIKFTDVSEDHGYRLHLAIHFIDPKTNTEIATIPLDTYVGHVCGLEGCLEKEVTKTADRIKRAVDSPPGTKL
jgi:hypothetical protein